MRPRPQVSGTLHSSTLIDGEYYTVNPIAVNHERVNVYTRNKRMARPSAAPPRRNLVGTRRHPSVPLWGILGARARAGAAG